MSNHKFWCDGSHTQGPCPLTPTKIEPMEGFDLDGEEIVAARYSSHDLAMDEIATAELEYISAIERLYESAIKGKG